MNLQKRYEEIRHTKSLPKMQTIYLLPSRWPHWLGNFSDCRVTTELRIRTFRFQTSNSYAKNLQIV